MAFKYGQYVEINSIKAAKKQRKIVTEVETSIDKKKLAGTENDWANMNERDLKNHLKNTENDARARCQVMEARAQTAKDLVTNFNNANKRRLCMVPGEACPNAVQVCAMPCAHMIVCARHQNQLATHFRPLVCPVQGCGV